MSVSLSPSSSLGFKRPLTTVVNRPLNITNHNAQPVAFKVKTTAPKLYCVRPNSGRVEPGETVQVSVMLQAMKEEPPNGAKCKDKFLIQSTLITPEKETMSLQAIWNATDASENSKVHQQKLRVVYLPAEGQTLEEEDEGQANMSILSAGDRYDTVRTRPAENGHTFSTIIEDTHDQPQHSEPENDRPLTPPGDFSVAREESHEEPMVSVNVHPPPAPSPSPPPPPVLNPAPIPVSTPAVEPQTELYEKYQAAQAEIERLRALLAASSPPTELRRRTRALSDDGSTLADSDIGTMVEDRPIHQQEGVPLQVVVIIALGVFITTYLFF